MSSIDKIAPLFDGLDPVERESLIFDLSKKYLPVAGVPRDSASGEPSIVFPSIVSTPGVCGGSPRLIRTRIPVWTLERMRQLGATDADVLSNFPSLRATDLVQAWAYADRHREDIEREIRENEED